MVDTPQSNLPRGAWIDKDSVVHLPERTSSTALPEAKMLTSVSPEYQAMLEADRQTASRKHLLELVWLVGGAVVLLALVYFVRRRGRAIAVRSLGAAMNARDSVRNQTAELMREADETRHKSG